MDCQKASIIQDVRKYIAVLRENGISVDKALLFGSWARGTAREESDVDVALVSSFSQVIALWTDAKLFRFAER